MTQVVDREHLAPDTAEPRGQRRLPIQIGLAVVAGIAVGLALLVLANRSDPTPGAVTAGSYAEFAEAMKSVPTNPGAITAGSYAQFAEAMREVPRAAD
ncbi:MAG: hypothetical protein ACT4OP_03560 [Actinomycetota bacterium]